MKSQHQKYVAAEILDHYENTDEETRLRRGDGRLEFVRTQELLRRFLPAPPASVLDVGGGSGIHAEWLAADGYQVHLVDPVQRHVEQASRLPGVTAAVGDARALAAADEAYDAVLLLGPLYHLNDPADRGGALLEAHRVVRPGGLVAAAAISRFASLHDGLRQGRITDPHYLDMVRKDLAEGNHRPPSDQPAWFTTAYMHHPTELAQEVEQSPLDLAGVFAVEGVSWLLPDVWEWLDDPSLRERLLWTIRQGEQDSSLLGATSHLLAVAHRPRG